MFRSFSFLVFGVIVFSSFVVQLYGSTIHAHEIGTTRVSVLFHEGGTYDVEIVTDAATLAEKLTAVTGDPSSANLGRSELQSTLTRFDEAFRQRVKLRFDDSNDRPRIAYAVAPGGDGSAATIATIKLTGTVPANAHQFTWSYGWTFAS